MKLRTIVFLVLIPAFPLFGCGPKLESLSGTVTFDGQPVKAGSVTFLPQGGGDILPTSASIKDGSFVIPKSMGITKQQYRIVVTGYDGVPIEFSPEGKPIFRDYQFDRAIDDPATPITIDVPASLKIKQR